MLTNLVRELDDHDLSVLHTRNTQNGLVGVACVNPLHKKISRTVQGPTQATLLAQIAWPALYKSPVFCSYVSMFLPINNNTITPRNERRMFTIYVSPHYDKLQSQFSMSIEGSRRSNAVT